MAKWTVAVRKVGKDWEKVVCRCCDRASHFETKKAAKEYVDDRYPLIWVEAKYRKVK